MVGKFLIDALRDCQKAINLAYDCGQEIGLTYNASKTDVIHKQVKIRGPFPAKHGRSDNRIQGRGQRQIALA